MNFVYQNIYLNHSKKFKGYRNKESVHFLETKDDRIFGGSHCLTDGPDTPDTSRPSINNIPRGMVRASHIIRKGRDGDLSKV